MLPSAIVLIKFFSWISVRWGHPYEKGKYIEFTEEDRTIIVDRSKSWRFEGYETPYEDIPEFCYAAKKAEVIAKDYNLVPSHYVEVVRTV